MKYRGNRQGNPGGNSIARQSPRIAEYFFTVLVLVILIMSFYPLLWMFLNSFKSNTEVFQKPLSLPSKWNFSIFSRAWITSRFSSAIIYSCIVTSSVVAINLACSGMAAYSISHLHFKGKGFFLSFCIGCQVVSGQVLIVPLYNVMLELGIFNTVFGLILVMSAYSLPFSTYLLNGFFRGIPKEIHESTRIDGCGNWRYFLEILIPLSTPIIASNCIFQALFAWNEYLFTLTFLRDMTKWTIQPMLKNQFTGYQRDFSLIFASLSIVTVPIFIMYIFMQRYFIRGLTAGAIKG
jgi:raffinose/stachyose/melibiose transport system permease protein